MLGLTTEEYQDYTNDYLGVCLNCEELADNVEPDAENYKCDYCGENMVMGLEQALICGSIDIV